MVMPVQFVRKPIVTEATSGGSLSGSRRLSRDLRRGPRRGHCEGGIGGRQIELINYDERYAPVRNLVNVGRSLRQPEPQRFLALPTAAHASTAG
jgi:hypothetical protein